MAEKLKSKKKEDTTGPGYNPSGDELKVWDQYTRRKNEMQDGRGNVNGIDIDAKMLQMDRLYFNRVAQNLSKTELDITIDPIAMNRAFRKVQSALSVLIDRNPKLVLKNTPQRYSANKTLIEALANSSWQNTNSLNEFKLSVFNAAKRGWFVGRTFNRQLIHDARFPMKTDNKGLIAYETRKVVKMDDIAYMNLDNHNTWLDEEARPFDMLSVRDGMHREVWHIDKIKDAFPEKEFPNMKLVKSGGDVSEVLTGDTSTSSSGQDSGKEQKEGMTEMYFYEHQYDDWFIIEINKVMVVWEPMPQNDKRLSYVTGGWLLRDAETIYMIGIVEMMERSEELLDYILNANLRQLTMLINPPGFYAGTEDFENENIKLKAGVMRRTTNPQDINFVEFPPIVGESLNMMDRIKDEQDADTGVNRTIEGDTGITKGSGDTAFEFGISREASLKRLRLPLHSLKVALEWEFANRIDRIKQTYSNFDVKHIVDRKEIQDYLVEVDADPDFYFIQNQGVPGQEKFFAKQFRELNLNIEQDDEGNFTETEEENFFKIKPEWLQYEGDVTIDVNAMLISEELERADTLRMTNLLLPMFELPPEIALKPARQLLRAYNKEPKNWLPQEWLDFDENQKTGEGAAAVPGTEEGGGQQPAADTLVPPTDLEGKPGLGQRFSKIFSRK